MRLRHRVVGRDRRNRIRQQHPIGLGSHYKARLRGLDIGSIKLPITNNDLCSQIAFHYFVSRFVALGAANRDTIKEKSTMLPQAGEYLSEKERVVPAS
jgi:hypothetical protein